MRKFKIVWIVLILASAYAKAQTISRDSVAGVWTCIEATFPGGVKIPADEVETMNVLKSAIVNSKFLFKATGLFEWQFPKGAPAVFQQIDFLNNQKWSIDSSDLVIIGDPKENLMQIAIRGEAGKTFFILSDTPLLLKMKKE